MRSTSVNSKVAAIKAAIKRDSQDPDIKMFTGGNPACDPITNGGGVSNIKKRGAKKDAPINTKRLLTMSITTL